MDIEKLSRELTDQGKIIEAGWISLRQVAMEPAAPQIQIDEMRMAFFAGAQHLFSSILAILDPGEDFTAADLERLDLIHAELEEFVKAFKLKRGLTKGSA